MTASKRKIGRRHFLGVSAGLAAAVGCGLQPEQTARLEPPRIVEGLTVSGNVYPRLREAPAIDSTTWVNSPPLSASDLRGNPYLVEFWTFGCYNCKNVIPSMNAWYEELRPHGLEIVSVHSPEFSYEQALNNVRTAVASHGIEYPVAIDNDFSIWRAYGNQYWPTMYLADSEGWIRYVHIGEGNYDKTRQAIIDLLFE